MTHSWGTSIGIKLAQKCPELYEAYIAMGQMTNQEVSEERAYIYMLNYYKEIGDTKTLKKLKKAGFGSKAYAKMRDHVMHKAGIGTTREIHSIIKGVVFPSLACKAYTWLERINIWRGKLFPFKAWQKGEGEWSRGVENVTEIKIPIYFFMENMIIR